MYVCTHTHTPIVCTLVLIVHVVFDGAPRSEVDIQSRSGPLLGEPVSAANKAKVLYGIAKDPEVAAQLAEMEEEREEGQEEDKPKVGVYSSLVGCVLHTWNILDWLLWAMVAMGYGCYGVRC